MNVAPRLPKPPRTASNRPSAPHVTTSPKDPLASLPSHCVRPLAPFTPQAELDMEALEWLVTQ